MTPGGAHPTRASRPELTLARVGWRGLGVWYSVLEGRVDVFPLAPEHLLLATAWLFAYDFKLQTLVATWLKKNLALIDMHALVVNLGGASGPHTPLALAYIKAVAGYLKWRGGVRAFIKWRATQRLRSCPVTMNDIAPWRRGDTERVTRVLRLRNDKCLASLGLALPAICLEHDRKVLPHRWVAARVAEVHAGP